ncbi:DUF1758 domain-containing protein [Trichonephila clavipes]|uniref:DUF1758 domain-containing protein n=1 Tax=Trichonephila clavipes TaxID=2585209 RepID=A0A8X6VYY9_TRICX|nr:DUF1758 domain-containing protein [Trichonephila clavipes]
MKALEVSLTTTKVPSLDEFISFLELRCIQLEAVIKPPEIVTKNVPIKNKATSGLINPRWKSFLTKEKLKPTISVESIRCQKEYLICHKKNKDPIFNCESFLNHSPLERYELCKKNNICTNRLNYHPDKKCVSTSRCKICNKFHTTKLHREKEDDSSIASASTPGEASKVNTEQCFAPNAYESPRVKYMLSTAIIYMDNIPVRIILYSGSEINLIDSDSATTLGLKRNKMNSTVFGFNGLAQKINYSVNANISNQDASFNQHLKFLVVPNISSFTPSCTLDISKIFFPKHIKLADPSFHKPSKVSMLLGAQVFFKIIKADQIKINDSVTFQNSVFNYIVTGGLPAADDKQQCFLLSEQEGLKSLISKFWQLESTEDEPRNLNSQVKFCEEHFVNNHRRDESGQYIVQVAYLKELSCLGESKQTAICRLNSLWRKLDVNPNLKQLY